MHKTTIEFYALPSAEQDFWIAREMRKAREMRGMIKSLRNMEYGDAAALTVALINSL